MLCGSVSPSHHGWLLCQRYSYRCEKITPMWRNMVVFCCGHNQQGGYWWSDAYMATGYRGPYWWNKYRPVRVYKLPNELTYSQTQLSLTVREITKSSSTVSATNISNNMIWFFQLHDTIKMKSNHTGINYNHNDIATRSNIMIHNSV